LVKASSSGTTSLRVRSPMWSRRRSVTINHLPGGGGGGGEADSGDWTVATGDDDGRRPRSKEEGEGLRCHIVIGSKKEHTTNQSKTTTKTTKKMTKSLDDDEDDDDDDEAEEDDEDKEEEERRGSVYARFTMISQTIERVAHLVAAMQDQLALCEALMEDLLPASSPSSSSTSPSSTSSSSSAASSSSSPSPSTSSPPWRAQVRSLPQHKKVALLRRIRSVNAILYSAASTLGSVADTDHHHDQDGGGGAGAWRRSGAWISAGAGSDGRAEEERELLGRRQAALGLVASMRARLATFKQRLEDGLVDDAELTTEANRIGFVVEYLAHSLRQPS
jgi:hypothetical protein